MPDEAEKRIGHLYPKVTLPREHGGGEATVIAWIWARTVKCPNPACQTMMPLTSSFWLSKSKGKKAWIEPVIDRTNNTVRFKVRNGEGISRDGTINRRGAQCIVCNGVTTLDHVRTEGKAGRIRRQLMAIAAEGNRRRLYLNPCAEHVCIANNAIPTEVPNADLPRNPRDFKTPNYGMMTFGHLFTQRQLLALTTFSDLVSEAKERVEADAIDAGHGDAKAYADANATYLAFAVSKNSHYWCALSTWHSGGEKMQPVFARQAIPMVWDFSECNPFGSSSGNLVGAIQWIVKAVAALPATAGGFCYQQDASNEIHDVSFPLVSTDPPYYDNVGYADLSDFFYIWLRRSLRGIYPDLFNLILVPKSEELVATPYRFGGDKLKAEEHFLSGLGQAFNLMRCRAHSDYPLTVYYAFKQSETDKRDGAVASTAWESMLDGLFKASFQITGTWPMHTEMKARSVSRVGANTLASSIVLVCRLRPDDAETSTRRDFISILRRELPESLQHLQRGNIAPVDLAQAAIGPGMAVFSRFSSVLEADGNPMRVRTALQIINAELDAYFAAEEGDLDADTRFCTAWFEQYGMGEGAIGEADVLARAKNSSVEGVAESGALRARAGKVRLLNRDEYQDEWDPTSDSRRNTWKCTQYLIRALERGGETEAGRLVNLLGGGASEAARALAYRLYAICDRKGWAQEAVAYNRLVTSWTHIQAAAPAESGTEERPGDLF